MDEKLLEANILFQKGEVDEALNLLNTILESENQNVDCLMLRATIFYKMQQWGNALNDLNLILEKEPNHQAATNYKTMIMNILTFWNKESFNP